MSIASPVSPVIVITGPTASGKSSLAMELAERYGGEIICADSRTVYKGMDIGTAKPTLADRQRVPHHLLDVVRPDQRFTASDFQRLAREAIDDIRRRGKIPFVVGGTGLYIDSLVLGYQFGPDVDAKQRETLMAMTLDELTMMLKKHRIPLPINDKNKRYLIRAIEQQTINTSRSEYKNDEYVVVAIATDKHYLEQRICARTDEIFASGVVEETRQILRHTNSQYESMTGNIYPIMKRMINGEITEQEAKELFIIKDRQLAKRQVTWLKRHSYIKWLSLEEAKTYLTSLLAGTAAN